MPATLCLSVPRPSWMEAARVSKALLIQLQIKEDVKHNKRPFEVCSVKPSPTPDSVGCSGLLLLCNTQMDMKWTWNNRKTQWTSITLDDRITNHWFLCNSKQFSSSNAAYRTCCYLQIYWLWNPLIAFYIHCKQWQMIFWYVILYLCVWFL